MLYLIARWLIWPIVGPIVRWWSARDTARQEGSQDLADFRRSWQEREDQDR